jgi:hypothetical protein
MGRCPSEEASDPQLPTAPLTASAGPGPNDWERAKLELARAAIAQAEREGRRTAVDEETPVAPLSPEEAETLKLQRLQAPRETPVTLIDFLYGTSIREEDGQ